MSQDKGTPPDSLNSTAPPVPPVPSGPPTPYSPASPASSQIANRVTDSRLTGVGQAIGDPRNAFNYINPPADRRLNSILDKLHSPLRHGIIQQTDINVASASQTGLTNGQDYPFACKFMFNPAVVAVDYAINNRVIPMNQMTSAQLQSKSFFPGSTTLSFSLLFDRTYDVYYGPKSAAAPDLRKIGVRADIYALEAVVGVHSAQTENKFDEKGASSGNTTADRGVKNSVNLVGNMVMTPVYILFGGGEDTAGLAFACTITGLRVNYALFSENMIPTRCSVDISATTIVGIDPAEIYAAGGKLDDRIMNGNRVTTTAGGNFAVGQAPYGQDGFTNGFNAAGDDWTR